MSRKSNPWDNAGRESFMNTLKYESAVTWPKPAVPSHGFWNRCTTKSGRTRRNGFATARQLETCPLVLHSLALSVPSVRNG